MKLFNYHEKCERKKMARLPLSAYLSYLLVAILLFTGVSFSKFAITASGEDGARVAYVVASASGVGQGEGTIDVAAGDKFEYMVTVSNAKDGQVSEVALEYAICIKLPEDFPQMAIDVSDAEKDTSSTDTMLIFRSSKQLAAGTATTNNHIITIAGTNDTVGRHSGLEVNISVKAEQVN